MGKHERGVEAGRLLKLSRLALTSLAVLLSVAQAAAVCPPLNASSAGQQLIEGARPVAQAVAMISRESGWTITYEDPVYVNADDLVDVTAVPDHGRRLIIPRSGCVTVTEHATANGAVDPTGLLESMIRSQETRNIVGPRFKVVRTGSVLHVVPSRSLDREGVWRDAAPVLDTTVRLSGSGGNVTLLDYLAKLCSTLSEESGTRVRLGRVPTRLMLNAVLRPEERKAPARALLLEALTAAGTPLTWLLFYDPSESNYVLNIGPPGMF